MNASILTTVLSLEVLCANANEPAVQSDFQRSLGAAARQFGTVVSEGVSAQGLQTTLVLAAEASAAAVLRRLSASMDEFVSLYPSSLARVLAHHGVVFASESQGRPSFMGSAIRSVQSAVYRLGDLDGLFATRDFANYVASWPQSPLRLDPVRDVEGIAGLCEIRFDASFVLPSMQANEVLAGDAEFLRYIKRRLAEELGPFANALVDAAQRSAPSASHLVREVASEIDDITRRKRFETDADAWLKAHPKR